MDRQNKGFQIGRHFEPSVSGDTSGSPSSTATLGTISPNAAVRIEPV
jgi:hypothetical protein